MKGFNGYEFDAVIEARKEVKERLRRNLEEIKNAVRSEQEERNKNGVLQPLRPWISLR
jgi:hypothetical protein